MSQPDADQDSMDRLVAAVTRSAHYRGISPDLIAAIGRRELAAGRDLKDAIKATKSRLHQIFGAFQQGGPRYATWLAGVEAAAMTAEPTALRNACAAVMRRHASTRERLPLLDRFYAEILAGLPPPRSVLDLGCGLHPLALPWMGLPPDVSYRCYDIDAGLVDFLNRFFALTGFDGHASLRDLASAPPEDEVDLALALKLLPSLDHLARGAAAALLRGLRARHVLVSFPAHSLGGRQRGMPDHYELRFSALLAGQGRTILRRIPFSTELVFLIEG